MSKELIIITALIGAAIGDILPTPADGLYFFKQKQLNDQLAKGEITPRKYWIMDAVYYYSLNPLYWLILAFIVYAIKGDYHLKVKVLLVILAGGMVIGILAKNIKKDEQKINT